MEDAFEQAVLTGRAVDLRKLETTILSSGKQIAGAQLDGWEYDGKDADVKGMKIQKGMRIDEFAVQLHGDKGADLVDKTLGALQDLVERETQVLMAYLQRRRRAYALTDFMLTVLGVTVGALIRGRRGSAFSKHVLRERGRWMAEVKATLARLQAEVKLDNRNNAPAKSFGLSDTVQPDILYAVTLVGDVKTGTYHKFYETVATGYAIFAEYALQKRINTAAILTIDLDLSAGKVRSHRVVSVRTDDALRHRWLTTRDRALDIIDSPNAPQHPADLTVCPNCIYLTRCWEGGTVGGNPITPPHPPTKAPSKAKQPPAKS